MDNKKLKLDFEMRIQDIEDNDDRFAKAKVLIAYCGRNRNYSDISKEVFEQTPIANIPVVARYDSNKDDFCGHDVRVIDDGEKFDIVSATVPFGVVPESAEQWFEEAIVDGESKTCFCTDVILWKRQYGYEHIAKARTINQSMEINVTDYIIDSDGYCIVNKMNFEALTLLGDDVEPCFENSRLTLYSKTDSFEQQYQEMLEQYKAYSLKLRNEVSEMEKEEILEVENDVVKDVNIEEEPIIETPDSTEEISEPEDIPSPIEEVPIETPVEENSFKEDSEETPTDYEAMYNNILAELEELRAFKANIEKEKEEAERNAVFEKFESKLGSIQDFMTLKENCAEYSVEQLEEKCYAIVGRYGISMTDETPIEEEPMKFSINTKTEEVSPYGNVFNDYAN